LTVNNSRLVYSTDAAIIGNRKPQPAGKTVSPSKAQPPGFPNDGIVRISREKGNRGGKTVTMIRGLPETGDALTARAQELKRACGAGGTIRDGAIEIQGDHRERLLEKLTALGYKMKLTGG
jgi:translation initiation factor 1